MTKAGTVLADKHLIYLVGATAPRGTLASAGWRDGSAVEPDAQALLALARLHDVVLPTSRAVAGLAPGVVFAPTARDLALRALAMTRELAMLALRFEAAGIAVAALKGPVLSLEIFQSPAMRDPGDLDLLIHPQDLAAADTTLIGAGYAREPGWEADFDAGDLSGPLARVFHIGYRDPRSDITVEIHWRWFHIEEVMPFDPALIWRDARQVSVGGTPVTVLSPAVQLVYLAFHAAKHECERLKWLNDLAWLLPRLDEPVVAEAVALATRLGILDLFLAPFLVAEQLGVLCMPPSLAALSRPASRRLGRIFLTSLAHPSSRAHIGTLGQRLRWQRTYWRLASHRARPVRARLLAGWARLHFGWRR